MIKQLCTCYARESTVFWGRPSLFDFGNFVVLQGLPRIDYSSRLRGTGCRSRQDLEWASALVFRHAALFFQHPKWPVLRASGRGFDLTDKNAAWAEMTSVCGDLVGSVSRNLKQNAEWQMELLDQSKKPFIQNPPCRADARLKADSVGGLFI